MPLGISNSMSTQPHCKIASKVSLVIRGACFHRDTLNSAHQCHGKYFSLIFLCMARKVSSTLPKLTSTRNEGTWEVFFINKRAFKTSITYVNAPLPAYTAGKSSGLPSPVLIWPDSQGKKVTIKPMLSKEMWDRECPGISLNYFPRVLWRGTKCCQWPCLSKVNGFSIFAFI